MASEEHSPAERVMQAGESRREAGVRTKEIRNRDLAGTSQLCCSPVFPRELTDIRQFAGRSHRKQPGC